MYPGWSAPQAQPAYMQYQQPQPQHQPGGVTFWPQVAPPGVYGQPQAQAMTFMPPMTPMQQPVAMGWPQSYSCPSSPTMGPAPMYGQQAYSVMPQPYAEPVAGFDEFGRPQTAGQLQQQAAEAAAVPAFLRELGIEPEEEEDFSWIAEYGMQADALPSGWTVQVDSQSGKLYYVDDETQESRWENPLMPHLKHVVDAGRMYLGAPTEEFFVEARNSLFNETKQALESWHGPLTDEASGRSYFHNHTTGESTWKDPRESAQYFLELESNLLTSLSQVLPSPEDLDVPTFGGAASSSRRQKVTLENGAEVLNLESPTGTSTAAERRRLSTDVQAIAKESAAHDSGRALRTAVRAKEWLQDVCQAEELAQRRQLKKRAEMRRLRKFRSHSKDSHGAQAAAAAAARAAAAVAAAAAAAAAEAGGAGFGPVLPPATSVASAVPPPAETLPPLLEADIAEQIMTEPIAKARAAAAKAKALLEMNDILRAAIRSGDLVQLTAALAQAERNGVEATPLAQKARAMVQAMQSLEAATQGSGGGIDLDALSEALRNAEAAGAPAELIAKARARVEAGDTLKAALESGDIRSLEAALTQAERAGLSDTPLGQKVRAAIQAAKALQAVMQSGNAINVDALEAALRAAEADGAPAALITKAQQLLRDAHEQRARRKREDFLANLEKVGQCHETLLMRATLAEGEALGFHQELEPLRKALEVELSQMMERASEWRKKQEKLATDFKDAKEAQEFGGAVFVAQWRAAVAEVSRPFEFNEEMEHERQAKKR